MSKKISIKRIRSKVVLTGIVLLLLSIMLAACGNNASTPQTGSGSAVTPTAAATTPVTTTPPATAGNSGGSTPTKTGSAVTTAPTQKVYNPVIYFSTNTLKVGESLTVSGSGYPTNTKLNIAISYRGAKPYGSYGTPTTDGQGNFSTKVTLDKYDHAKALDPGKVVIVVSTVNGGVAASAPVTLEKADPVYKPLLQSSSNTVTIGTFVTITGSGFPAKTELKLLGGVQNPGVNYGTVKTDEDGRFGWQVTLNKPNTYLPGPWTFVAATADDKISAKVTLTLVKGYTPELQASSTSVKIGSEVTLTGKGFPANTSLKLAGGVQNPGIEYGTVQTDAQGNFTKVLKLNQPNIYTPGPWSFTANTEDFKFSALATITLT